MIKPKLGYCTDCPDGTAAQHLTAGRCQTHYWRYRAQVNKEKPRNKAKNEGKAVLGTYFANQILQMPERCEECNNHLPKSPAWMRRACVAHILKKRTDYGFPSVAIHPLNKMFFCPDCHTNMDNFGDHVILKMKSLPIMIERVQQLMPLLTQVERSRVPYYFLTGDCSDCDRSTTQHTCPFAEAFNDDKICTCCPGCTSECADRI